MINEPGHDRSLSSLICGVFLREGRYIPVDTNKKWNPLSPGPNSIDIIFISFITFKGSVIGKKDHSHVDNDGGGAGTSVSVRHF